MDVPVDSDEHFLDEILCPLPVARGAVNEIEQARLIAIDKFFERALLTVQKGADDGAVVQGAKLFPDRRARRANRRLQCDVRHMAPLDCCVSCALTRQATSTVLLSSVVPPSVAVTMPARCEARHQQLTIYLARACKNPVSSGPSLGRPVCPLLETPGETPEPDTAVPSTLRRRQHR